jgi:TatD DNase family protein
MVDTHCHLDACEDTVDALVARARAAGVLRMLTIGMNGDSGRQGLEAAEEHEEVFVAIGRHPHEAAGFDDEALTEVAELARHPKVRAIGETGLDYYRDRSPRRDQQRAFQAQIELAETLHLPLVIHTRAATDDTLAMLERGSSHGVPIVLHCFSLADRLDECLEYGYYCSFAGNVTYPQAKELQEAAARVPDELLLVETDAPFLAPQDQRGKPNEPANVRATAAFLAELRGQSYEDLEAAVQSNAEWIFSW